MEPRLGREGASARTIEKEMIADAVIRLRAAIAAGDLEQIDEHAYNLEIYADCATTLKLRRQSARALKEAMPREDATPGAEEKVGRPMQPRTVRAAPAKTRSERRSPD